MTRVGYLFNHDYILGGGEISFLDLISGIREHDVLPVAFVPAKGEISDRLDSMGIKWVESPWPHLNPAALLNFPKKVSLTAELFLKENLDMVHVNGARAMLYAGPASKRSGMPCVWHVRVLERDFILDRIRAHYASAIIANSKASAQSLLDIIGNKHSVEVIYNGFDLDAIDRIKPLDLKKEFGVSDEPVILCVGRLTRWKRFQDVIRACSLLRMRNMKFLLLMVGSSTSEESDYEKELKDLVKAEKTDNVFFAGWRDDVCAIMKSANVLVLSSKKEPFGRVIVEALACGLPVVATREGGPEEILKDGSNGLLVPQGDVKAIADAIEKILSDRNLSDCLSMNGIMKAKEFSIVEYVEEVASIYKALI